MIKQKVTILSLILTVFFSVTSIVFAQSTFESIQFNVSPNNPEIGQSVTISIDSFIKNLSTGNIEWYKNGEKFSEGAGKTQTTVKITDSEPVLIKVNLTENDGKFSTYTHTITPNGIDIFYESIDGHIPPFYKGRNLPVAEGKIRMVAMPTKNVENVSYAWKKNLVDQSQSSGLNRSSFVYENDSFDNSDTVTVLATSNDNSYVSRKSLRLKPFSPRVIFYKKDDVNGFTFEGALRDNHFITDSIFKIVAVPYYLSGNLDDERIKMNWNLGAGPLERQDIPNEITISRGDQTGKTSLSFDLENTTTRFQKGKTKIDLIFK